MSEFHENTLIAGQQSAPDFDESTKTYKFQFVFDLEEECQCYNNCHASDVIDARGELLARQIEKRTGLVVKYNPSVSEFHKID